MLCFELFNVNNLNRFASIPGNAVRTVTSTNTSANISADTSSVMSPEKETVRWTECISGQTAPSHIISAHSPLKASSFSPVRRKQGFQVCLRIQKLMELIFMLKCRWLCGDQHRVVGGGRRQGEEGRGEEVCDGIDSCYRCLVHLKLLTHFIRSVWGWFWSWSSLETVTALRFRSRFVQELYHSRFSVETQYSKIIKESFIRFNFDLLILVFQVST